MDEDALIKRLMATFADELGEHARTIERGALALAEGSIERRSEEIPTLFRSAHSLKGAARAVNLRAVESLCHALENTLGRLRDSESDTIAPELLDGLFATADVLGQSHRRLLASERLDEAAIGAVTRRLDGGQMRPASPRPLLGRADGGGPSRSEPRAAEPPLARVAATKLDDLVARSGQLLVARRRASDRLNDVMAIQDGLARCRSEWRRIERPLRGLGRRRPVGSPTEMLLDRLVAKRTAVAVERTTSELREMERSLEQLARRMAADHHAIDLAANPLDEGIRHLRMAPFSGACEELPRLVHELARDSGKQARLVVEGGDVELDRAIVDMLKDPLLHLVNNAFDHGVEMPAERRRVQKPPCATITVAASLRSSGVAIVVSDDGRGIDLARVRRIASSRGLGSREDDRDALSCLFLPGFTTAPAVTEVSGRGVGLDVVKHRVEALHGQVDVSAEPGRGTRFNMVVPLTLTKIRALLLREGTSTFALPTANVQRVARVDRHEIRALNGRDVLPSEGAPVPVRSLADVLGVGITEPASDVLSVVFVRAGGKAVALVVDELINEQEVVVKGLGARIRRARWFSGTTILANGRLALIIHAPDVVTSALVGSGRLPPPRADADRVVVKRRVLIVDDSVTTRSLEKSIVEAAGYEVLVASDGADGWRLLQERGADLVVADVEMPRMDGIALCETIRDSARFKELPVILVTGLDSEQDRLRGLRAGANAYLPKSGFDQRQLLETIGRLV